MLGRQPSISQESDQMILAPQIFDEDDHVPGPGTGVALWKLWKEPDMLMHVGARTICLDEAHL